MKLDVARLQQNHTILQHQQQSPSYLSKLPTVYGLKYTILSHGIETSNFMMATVVAR
jgi:hypothetical protein